MKAFKCVYLILLVLCLNLIFISTPIVSEKKDLAGLSVVIVPKGIKPDDKLVSEMVGACLTLDLIEKGIDVKYAPTTVDDVYALTLVGREKGNGFHITASFCVATQTGAKSYDDLETVSANIADKYIKFIEVCEETFKEKGKETTP